MFHRFEKKVQLLRNIKYVEKVKLNEKLGEYGETQPEIHLAYLLFWSLSLVHCTVNAAQTTITTETKRVVKF